MKKSKHITKVASIILAAFSMVFHVSATTAPLVEDEVTIVHGRGETTVKKNAKKVVVFDIGSLETFHELGIPVTAVTSSVPTYLSEYRSDKYIKVGSIMSPDMDGLKALQPDLIIISGRQGSSYDELSAIAPTLFLGVNTKDYWNSFEKNVRAIAQIYGKETLAEQKLTELKRKRDLVTAKSNGDTNKGIVLLQVRGGHTAYGEGSRFGFPHDVLGIRSSTELNDETHTGHRFQEGDGLVKKADPDYIFLIDRDSAVGDNERKPTDELLSTELKQTKAYKNKKVFDLPGNIWYVSGGGLVSVDKQITDIGEQLYGIKF